MIGSDLVKDAKKVLPLSIKNLLLYPENFVFEADTTDPAEPKVALDSQDTEEMEVDDGSHLTVDDFLMDIGNDHDYC